MKFAQLDPRTIPAAIAANNDLFETYCGVCDHSSGQYCGETCRHCQGTGLVGLPVMGIEVTLPEWARKCSLGNIDPQHSDPSTVPHWVRVSRAKSAIEACASPEFPHYLFGSAVFQNCTLVTVRPDMDSLGAMAVLKIRLERGADWTDEGDGLILSRIAEIGQIDNARFGEWSPSPLPTKGEEFPSRTHGLGKMCADFRVPLQQRVEWMAEFLLFGGFGFEGGDEVSAFNRYQAAAEFERAVVIEALEQGKAIEMGDQNTQYFADIGDISPIHIKEFGGIAVITSKFFGATTVGYCLAPVVVAVNPEFSISGGESHRKVTICQYQSGYVNLKEVARLLNKNKAEKIRQLELDLIEFNRQFQEGINDASYNMGVCSLELTAARNLPEWGGSETIIGSPQGVDCKISLEEIIAVVKSCMSGGQKNG